MNCRSVVEGRADERIQERLEFKEKLLPALAQWLGSAS